MLWERFIQSFRTFCDFLCQSKVYEFVFHCTVHSWFFFRVCYLFTAKFKRIQVYSKCIDIRSWVYLLSTIRRWLWWCEMTSHETSFYSTFFVIDYSSLNSPFMLDRVLAFIICNLFGFHFETKLRTFQYMRLQYLGCHIFPLDSNLDWIFLRLVVNKHFIQVDVLRSFSVQPSTPRKRLLPYYIKSGYAIKR